MHPASDIRKCCEQRCRLVAGVGGKIQHGLEAALCQAGHVCRVVTVSEDRAHVSGPVGLTASAVEHRHLVSGVEQPLYSEDSDESGTPMTSTFMMHDLRCNR